MVTSFALMWIGCSCAEFGEKKKRTESECPPGRVNALLKFFHNAFSHCDKVASLALAIFRWQADVSSSVYIRKHFRLENVLPKSESLR